jgi:hypothetical protein
MRSILKKLWNFVKSVFYAFANVFLFNSVAGRADVQTGRMIDLADKYKSKEVEERLEKFFPESVRPIIHKNQIDRHQFLIGPFLFSGKKNKSCIFNVKVRVADKDKKRYDTGYFSSDFKSLFGYMDDNVGNVEERELSYTTMKTLDSILSHLENSDLKKAGEVSEKKSEMERIMEEMEDN